MTALLLCAPALHAAEPPRAASPAETPSAAVVPPPTPVAPAPVPPEVPPPEPGANAAEPAGHAEEPTPPRSGESDTSRAVGHDGTTAVVMPTVTPISDCAACPALHRPSPESERELATLSRELDNLVVDGAQDLGFTIDVSTRPREGDEPPSDSSLIERAKGGAWVFSPRLAIEGTEVVVRIVVVPTDSRVLLVRSESFPRAELEVRAALMMRDLVQSGRGARQVAAPLPSADPGAVVHAARSRGRAVLALNAAALGGYIGFALQRTGGSNDARLTYPLIALGTGLGLGSSMIIADEWDVGLGDAWYMSAGMWWPTVGALLVAKDEPDTKRFLYGAAAAAGGMALATTSLTFGGMGEGNALVAHSGGAFGTMLGGIADLAVQGRTDVTPTEGMGIGAMTGVVLTGALARFTPSQASSRVLLVDLSAGLGALTGAAVASPLVFGDNVTPTRNRLWLSTIALGTFVGAGIGLFTTASPGAVVKDARRSRETPTVLPYAGVIAEWTKPDGSHVPAMGGGIQGVF